MDFEDGLRTATKLEVRNGLQSIRTVPEINMVSPLGLTMTLGVVWGHSFHLSQRRGRPNSNLPSSEQSVVFNYSCYCVVRIELA